MSTIESNLKNQPIGSISASSSIQPVTPLPSLPTIAPSTHNTSLPSSPTQFYDDKPIEKFYKKEKQILIEFDQIVKEIGLQLNEQIKCLEQRVETQLLILTEIQEYFRRRAEVEIDYANKLDNLHRQIGQKHRTQKARRETWPFQSIYQLWDTIVQDTRTHVKYHTVMSDVCGKYMYDKFNEIGDDTRRMFLKCKSVALASHEDIYKVLNELKSTMRTYHQYQSESKQAEQKLRIVQQQMAKIKSAKKQKAMEKRVQKRQMKYTETKVKAFKARNDYLMTIESVNAALQKYCSDDVSDLIDCMNFGFHTSIAKTIQMYLSAQDNIKRGRQATIDTINRAIGDLDTITDKQKYLELYSTIFTITKRIKFEPHKGDEVSTVNAQVLIRDEMQSRFFQMQSRLAVLKTEHDEIYKTIEATEQSLMEFINTKNSDVSDLFKDLNLPQNTSKNTRKEIEDYYVEKFKQYTLTSNLISRLQARHDIMQKALGAVPSASAEDKNLIRRPTKSKQIGRAPILGRPRLFGGKLLDYIQVTQQPIPLIISSCVSAINRLGLHNQGIFRVPGAQVDINQFKDAFEKGEDPLMNVTGRDMNSVAGVLKLYFRELKEPLFARDMFDLFISCIVDVETEDKCVENLCQVVKLLPHPIFVVMRYFLAFLNHLAEYSDENMMDASNLASCLAPTLIQIPEDKDQVQYLTHTIDLIRLMIVHHEEIFPFNDDGPIYEKFIITIPIDGEEDEDDEVITDPLRRTPSDDEMKMIEAVALFDYNGRNHKELSFKKYQKIYIYKKMNHEWWLGHVAGENRSGFIPDNYIMPKSRHRDSAPVQRFPFRTISNPSTSFNSVDFSTSSNDQLDTPMSNSTISNLCHQSSNLSFVDEHHFLSTKQNEILQVNSDLKNKEQKDNIYTNVKSYHYSESTSHTIYDILPLSKSTNDHNYSSSSSSSHSTSINDRQIIDIDITLNEVLTGIRTVEECHAECFGLISSTNSQKEIDAPDLVLNLPISSGLITPPASISLDEHQSSVPILHSTISNKNIPLVHSTVIIDLNHSSRSNTSSPELTQQTKIPPAILKKPEKTLEIIRRLSIEQQTKAALTPSNINHQQQKQQKISISGTSKATDV